MTRSKLVAILTGAIAILLSVVYLLIVQLLDFRGEMVPAPISSQPTSTQIVATLSSSIPSLSIAGPMVGSAL